MGRNQSPFVRQELAKLDKDPESRKSAMKTLKSYVRDLDSKAIPLFLAQVSETKGSVSPSGEHAISLYEVLARVHGRNIVPQIDNIMSTIVKTLMTSAGSFPLHQACSKVVPAIARYSIDPLTPDSEKARIIYSLCKPLYDILLGSPETVASGAALCLKALVETDNWRFVSDDVVNDICLRVASALEEKLTQTNAHMGLAMALAKHNSLTVEAYARSLVRSGLHILTSDFAEGNSQKRFTAIQMINFLMKFVDLRSIVSELTNIISIMERCYSDDLMPFVRAAAFETLQTAKILAADRSSTSEKHSMSVIGSNFSRRNRRKGNSHGVGDNLSDGDCRSPRFESPESRTINSFCGYDTSAESPLSAGQVSCNVRQGRLANRRILNNENCGVDVSLKDGLWSEISSAGDCFERFCARVGDDGSSETEKDDVELFSGFENASPVNRISLSATASPQGRGSHLTEDDLRIFTTPRKLIHSLQDPDQIQDGLTEWQAQKIRSKTSFEDLWIPERQLDEDGESHNPIHEDESERNSQGGGSKGCCEKDEADAGLEPFSHGSVALMESGSVVAHWGSDTGVAGMKMRGLKRAAISLIFGVSLMLPALLFSSMWYGDEVEYFDLIPT